MRNLIIMFAALTALAVGVSFAPAASAHTCPSVGSPPTYTVTPIPFSGEDFSGCDLTHARLANMDLTGVNLAEATLFSANLSGANLTGANLTGANLNVANLARANLTNANLSGAQMTRPIMSFAFVLCSDTGNLGTGISGSFDVLPSGWSFASGTLTVPIVPCPKAPVPVWMQAIGRDSAAASCPTWLHRLLGHLAQQPHRWLRV